MDTMFELAALGFKVLGWALSLLLIAIFFFAATYIVVYGVLFHLVTG